MYVRLPLMLPHTLSGLLFQVLHVFSEDDVWAFILSFNGIIDLTIAPSLIMYFVSDPSSRELTLFRVFRVFRALRVLRLHNLIRSRKHGYNYEWGVFVFSLSAIIFVAAGIFHALEDYPSRDRRLQFHDSLYYILVTLSTIGYGDIVPTRPLTEFFVMGLIIVVVTTVPAQIARLHALHVSIHAYDGAYVCRPGRGHVIVCGHVVHDSFADFLTEFYHPSRGVISFDIVVLSPDPPSPAMTRLLSNVVYATKTTFLKAGSLVHDVDRKRTQLASAEAVFVLADKDARATEAQDATTLLQALSIRNYADSTGCHIRMYLQMLSDDHQELSHIIGANQTIHSNRVKADLVCRGVVCPGSCALILNLMQSVDQAKMHKHISHPTPWMHEYIGGMSQQVYAVLLSDAFDGHLYEDVARRFFTGFEVVLLAVYRRDKDEDVPRVMLSPFGKSMRPGDIGFILATSASVVHAIQSEYASVVEGEESAPSPRHSSLRSIPIVSKSNLLQRKYIRKITLAPTNQPSSTPPIQDEVSTAPRSPSHDPKAELDTRLGAATFKAMTDMQGHVVVCGATRHILPLIDRLRAMYAATASPAPPLVLLVNHVPTANDFEVDYTLPPDVFFVRGVSTQCPDLLRVSIQRAKAVLLFPLLSSVQNQPTDDAYLLDYGVVTSLLCLETTCDNAKVLSTGRSAVTVARDEVGFYVNCNVPLQAVQSRLLEHFPTLNPDVFRAPSIENMSRRLSTCPAEASASSSSVAISSSFLSDLPSMAVLQRGSNIKFCRPRDVLFSCDSLPYLSPAFAAGRVFVDSRLDLVLCQAFYNPYITEILHLLTGNPLDPDVQGPTLTQTDIPVDFIGGCYGDVVLAMLRAGKLVLGLYRYPNMRLGNVVPYVLTSPPSDTLVFPNDKVFVVIDNHHSGVE
ncbi:hypothetical protein DYB31_010219 [Aphanomyces astaci]|uniref:Potassium channel domain-containing protein n=1 Tax=Aphanomyces astaci TaxID=112090 RepID=A0A397F340_APHAT|nr:hypothetical protein DYB31_010219 [Aphanomyces astaci]